MRGGGVGAVPSTMIERSTRDATFTTSTKDTTAISQGDMLIAAKQKRLMSASAGGNRKDMRKIESYNEEDRSKINEYNLYM